MDTPHNAQQPVPRLICRKISTTAKELCTFTGINIKSMLANVYIVTSNAHKMCGDTVYGPTIEQSPMCVPLHIVYLYYAMVNIVGHILF